MGGAKEKHATCRRYNFNKIRGVDIPANHFLEELHLDIGNVYDSDLQACPTASAFGSSAESDHAYSDAPCTSMILPTSCGEEHARRAPRVSVGPNCSRA